MMNLLVVKVRLWRNELVFHPIRLWPVHGPFTPLWREFIGSNIPFASRVNIISYVGTYYAIGAARIMTIVSSFIIGWFKGCMYKLQTIALPHH